MPRRAMTGGDALAGHDLVGRTSELAALADRLAAARRGDGSAVVLRGDAGIGKSALLAAARRQARDAGMTVLTARGTPAEYRLPFGALHQALWPLLRDSALPEGPKQALRAALGQRSAARPDLYGVAFAARQLLAGAAGAGPLLLAVEDGHWLDPSTAAVLSFAGQHLDGRAIAMIIAVRDGYDDAFTGVGLAALAVGPLGGGAAGALLDRGLQASGNPDLTPPARARLLAAAGGNPLALLELPVTAGGGGPGADGDVPGGLLPVTARLERAFAARLAGLPEETRTALLVLAADTRCTLAEITALTARLHPTASPAPLEPAVATGLVHFDRTAAAFRHPLVASAVYQDAPVSRRLAVHALLGELTAADPDRSVWHRVAAATGRDDALADDLVACCGRAAARGALGACIDALERAADLCTDAQRSPVLLLQAALFACNIPHGKARALALADKADPAALSPHGRALRAVAEELGGRAPMSLALVRPMVGHARGAWDAGDPGLAYAAMLCAAMRCWMNDAPAGLRTWIAQETDRLDPGWEHPSALMIRAYLLPVERGQAILARLAGISGQQPPGADGFEQARHALVARGLLGDFPAAVAALGPVVSQLRAAGELATASRFIGLWASADLTAGHWDRSLDSGREAEELALATGDPEWRLLAVGCQAWNLALRGQSEQADTLAGQILRDPAAAPYLRSVAHRALGLSALAAGRGPEAYDRLAGLLDPADPAHHYAMASYVADELADAARAAGRAAEARAVLAAAQAAADLPAGGGQPASVTSLTVGLSYARAVLAEGEAAGPALQAALAADLTDWPYHRARLQLAYGQWLRRQRRHAQARLPLREALAELERLGALPRAADARGELAAAGDPGTGPGAGPAGLSAQELRIARLAARGLSNREIAARLALSPRTVSAHLYRIFPKLGITSRAQLAAALGEPATTESGAVTGAATPGGPRP